MKYKFNFELSEVETETLMDVLRDYADYYSQLTLFGNTYKESIMLIREKIWLGREVIEDEEE